VCLKIRTQTFGVFIQNLAASLVSKIDLSHQNANPHESWLMAGKWTLLGKIEYSSSLILEC